jgi:predicted transposase/invertase (TIGR01784 family)
MSRSPHDAAFKAAFQKPKVAKSFFRKYFPKEVARRIDFRHFELRNRSYVDEALRERHSDIVYETRIRGATAFLYILFEHQSTPDPWMAFRLLCYMVNLWREFREANPDAKALPPILPAVLYHGERPWNAARSFEEIVAEGEGLEDYIPRFRYDLYDLADYPDERLLLGDSMALGVVLYLMKHIRDADFLDRLDEARRYLETIRDPKVQFEFLEWAIGYTFRAREESLEDVRRIMEASNNETTRGFVMTIAERLQLEGEQRGKLDSIQTLLRKRFGNVPFELEKRLEDSSIEVLDRFLVDFLDLDSLSDVHRWWRTRSEGGTV